MRADFHITTRLFPVLALALAVGRGFAGEPPAAEVKWHPGNYIFVQARRLDESLLYPHFLGVQKCYSWKSLEPAKDRYDFSGLRSDLDFLARHGWRLVIQIQTKTFGPGQNDCPAYLAGPDYGGGVYRTRWGSYNPVLWDDRVNRRLLALYRELGRAFDREPALEAMVIPETAITGELASQPVTPYTVAAYARSVEDGMRAMKEAFPHTVVIQYVNQPAELVHPLADFARTNGIGLGGPDIYPEDPVLNRPGQGVYPAYAPLAGLVPLGAAVQQNDYTQKAAFRGPPGAASVREIYDFGRDRLHLNYIFWGLRAGYFEQVRTMMDDPAFPHAPAGGLNATLPRSLQTGPGHKS